jgi:hypothetical protein
MLQEIKKFFLNSIEQNKKGLILALLFFVVFGLVFFQPTLAQENPGLGCNLGMGLKYVSCIAAEFIFSVLIKIAVLIFFGIPLLISALFVGIMGLILGWIISPDFISLKFTQNPFVDIGLSITRGFANMGFILFLVVIALATALRIEEYKAKKTLPTLIIIALLINFSPVFCGIIIDASNIVMNFFLNNITGLTGFVNIISSAALSLWNLIWTSGFSLGATIAAAMQVIISIVFNYFAGFIFILFSALFIMRYIMLWILVILSPIAFVSYILPITRKGQSLLSWKKWWEQLIAWSIIGIIAGFFLYLGFTMISMINASPGMFVTQPDLSWGGGGLGLMNNILPYLIPLVLLWIAYKETKRTSAMFAREIIEMPEKVAKGAVSAAIIAGAAVATAGVGAAAGAAGGAAKGLPGTVSRLGTRLRDYGEKHEGTVGGTVAGTFGGWEGRFEGWAKRQKEKIGGLPEAAKEDLKKRFGSFKEEHPHIAKVVEEMSKPAKAGLEGALLGFTKKEKVEGRKLRDEEKTERVRYKYDEETKGWLKTDQKLTEEEMKSGHLINIRRTRMPGGLIPSIKGIKPAIKKSVDEALKEIRKRAREFKGKTQEDWENAVRDALREIDEAEQISAEGLEKLRTERVVPENFELWTREEQHDFLVKARERGWEKRKRRGARPPEPSPGEEEEESGSESE